MSYIEIKNLSKTYKAGDSTIKANNNVSFSVEEGEVVVILGPSGAGKSTLLNILGGMETCDEGSQVLVDGKDIAKYNNQELISYRRNDVGFIFQFYNLIPNLTAKENVELASQIVKDSKDVDETLEQVGLQNRKDNFPSQLSGGEQQRVAIARAIAKNPKLLLCDEPTGALDYTTGKQVLKLLQDTSRNLHTTVIIITHNAALASMGDRVIRINDASVRDISVNESPLPIEEIEW